jgi:deoxyribodipyrimidine photolyase-related protein
VIGWREYVWNVYWHWLPGYRDLNALGAERPLPPVFTGAPTRMRCVERTLDAVERFGWAHHIQRLMVLGNLALLAGARPQELVRWMQDSFVDGAEWVMLPNVVGLSQWADGGRMATKPYASGGAYVNRMSDYCRSCPFDPRQRTGEDGCPLTALYWDFLARNRDTLAQSRRMLPALRGLDRLRDLEATRERAGELLARLERGEL